MRKFTLGLIALAAVAAMSGSANARERRFLFLAWEDGRADRSQQQQYYSQPQPQQYYYSQPQQPYYYREQRPNAFQQLWEMEQRKNAWLRQSFFGR